MTSHYFENPKDFWKFRISPDGLWHLSVTAFVDLPCPGANTATDIGPRHFCSKGIKLSKYWNSPWVVNVIDSKHSKNILALKWLYSTIYFSFLRDILGWETQVFDLPLQMKLLLFEFRFSEPINSKAKKNLQLIWMYNYNCKFWETPILHKVWSKISGLGHFIVVLAY